MNLVWGDYKEKSTWLTRQGGGYYYKYFQYKESELTRIISPVSWSSLVWSDVKQILHYNNVKLPVLLVKTQQGKNPQHHPFKDHKNLP